MWPFGEPLTPGTVAPAFSLLDQNGHPVSLSDFRGQPVVLIFYPGDETPVCRKQLCDWRDRFESLESSGVAVLGINPQSQASHARFSEHHGFGFPLLVDAGQKVAEAYQAKFIWTLRTVYLIGADGRVIYGERGRPTPSKVFAHLKLRV